LASRWAAELARLRAVFDSEFYTSADAGGAGGGFAALNASGTRQTVDALAVAAGAGSDAHRAVAAQALLADVTSRNFTLQVGAVGQKRLLSALSTMEDPAGHDAALRVALVSAFLLIVKA
jgi:hypothetical protein